MELKTVPQSNVELIDRLFSLSNRCAIGDGTAMSELLSIYHEDAEITPLREMASQYDGSAEDDHPLLLRADPARVLRLVHLRRRTAGAW